MRSMGGIGEQIVIELPNKTTRKALEEAKHWKNLPRFDTTEEFFEDLGL